MKKVEMLNYVLNFFWTGLGFLPVVIYWWLAPITFLFYGSLLISILLANIVQPFTLSSRPETYERLGVKSVRKFVQDGDYIRKGNQAIKGKDASQKYLLRILMFERFHTLCFLFFTFSTLHALLNGKILLSLFVLVANIFYNIYPILLQQYNRLRISRLLARAKS